MESPGTDCDIDLVNLNCPGGRSIAQALIGLRLHTAPVPGAIYLIKLFIRETMVMGFLRKTFQILLALALRPGRPFRFLRQNILWSGFFRRTDRESFRFIEKGELLIERTGLFRLPAIPLLV